MMLTFLKNLFFLFRTFFIYVCVLAVLGLCCCMGFSLDAVHGLLAAAASLVVEHWALGQAGFRSCGSPALERRLNSGGVQT